MAPQDAARAGRRMEPWQRWGATLPEDVELALVGPGAAPPAGREVVFVAGDLPDLARLLAGLGQGREVHVLDMGRDGLAQIAAVLEGRRDLAALHVLGHGQEGAVALGDLVLTRANLAEHGARLAAIGAAMAPDGDILLYGCDIGADAGLLQELAIVTGADLAASNDLTGAAALGGDWELEVRVGDVSAAPAVDAALAAEYGAVLALGRTTVTFDDDARFESRGSSSDASEDVIYLVPGSTTYRLEVDGRLDPLFVDPGRAYVEAAYYGGEVLVEVDFIGGQPFSIESIKLKSYFSPQNILVVGRDENEDIIGFRSVSVGTSFSTFTFPTLVNITLIEIVSFNDLLPFAMDDIVFSSIGAPPCFHRGTGIMTPFGRVAVERLRVGDAVLTQGGRVRRVVWLGQRRMNVARARRPQDVWPVRVRRDAFAPGVPARDVILSPDHAVFAGGVLIPVRYLVNGASVVQEAAREVEWWHVELDAHDILLADGLPAESYLDTGNRAGFDNAGAARHRLPDPAAARAAWAARGCARLCVDGPEVAAVRAGLLARLGDGITDDPALVVRGGGRVLSVERDGEWWHVAVPACVERLVLTSRSVRPAELDPGSDDWRRLGVAVSALLVDGRAVALDDACFGMGWLDSEGELRWMGGEASLRVVPGSLVSFFVPPLLRYHRAGVRPGPGEIQYAAAG